LVTLLTLAGIVLGMTACLGLAVVEWVAWMLVLPSRRPGTLAAQVTFAIDPDAPERRLGDPIVAVAPDGVGLAGLWHPARNPEGHNRGTVLLLHGYAEDPSGLQERMDALNAHGWDVAALDLRAHGRSGGDRASFGAREARDVSTWIDILITSGRLGDQSNPTVALWGRSMGASVCVHAASDKRIAALVLEAPYADLKVPLLRVVKRKRAPFARLFAALIARRTRRLSGISLFRPSPIELAPAIHAPVLIIHGTQDPLVSLAEVRRFADAFSRATLIEIAGAGHNSVVEIGGAPLLDQVATFLDGATPSGNQPTGLTVSVNFMENAPVTGLTVATPENAPDDTPA
jgi:alpha-beta hydrolase superfamily lysophospholipase